MLAAAAAAALHRQERSHRPAAYMHNKTMQNPTQQKDRRAAFYLLPSWGSSIAESGWVHGSRQDASCGSMGSASASIGGGYDISAHIKEAFCPNKSACLTPVEIDWS